MLGEHWDNSGASITSRDTLVLPVHRLFFYVYYTISLRSSNSLYVTLFDSTPFQNVYCISLEKNDAFLATVINWSADRDLSFHSRYVLWVRNHGNDLISLFPLFLWLNSSPNDVYSCNVMQRQTAVTAHFSSKPLLLFAFAGQYRSQTAVCLTPEYLIRQNRLALYTSKHETLIQCRFNMGQRRRRWSNIETTLDQSLVFAGIQTIVGNGVITARCQHEINAGWH